MCPPWPVSGAWALEEAGRMARYDFFRQHGGPAGRRQRIATAHHAADQAETVLLNLVRGTGMQGLAGIPPVRGRDRPSPAGNLPGRKSRTYLETHRLSHVEDETNTGTPPCGRNLLRREVMPRLAELQRRGRRQHLPHGGAAAAGGRVSGLRSGGGRTPPARGAYRRAAAACGQRALEVPRLRALRLLLRQRLPGGEEGLSPPLHYRSS